MPYEYWLLGFGLVIGLSIMTSYLTEFSLDTFLPSLYIYSIFVVFMELIPASTMYVFLVLNIIYFLFSLRKDKGA